MYIGVVVMQDNVYMARSLIRINFSEQDATVTVPACSGDIDEVSLSENPSYFMMLSHLRQFSDDQGCVRFFANINLNANNLSELNIDLTKTSMSGNQDAGVVTVAQRDHWQRMIHSLMH